ncbi:MAG: hypothetical protein M3Q71_05440 [Chloroflexota bacterium]|nr:hypothetical protein [Chloroflexota bacterium]MDP9470099.1 hypothetical protein [Chloroflexota bacterium]
MVRSGDHRVEQLMRDVADRRVSRRDLVKRAAAVGLAVPAAGVLGRTPTRQAAAQGSQPTGKLVISMSVEPDTLENWKAYSTDGHPILRNVQ